jgi:acyl carrier protein/RimJ/RimL family protein N-acetyltransferase
MSRAIHGQVLREGEHVELLHLGPDLYEALYQGLTDPAVASTWRPRGQYIPVAGWEQFLVERMAFSAVVRSRETGSLVGFVELRDVEPTDGYGYVSAAACAGYLGSGLMVEAVTLFIDEALSRSALHKVYFLLSEHSRSALAGTLDELLEVEGVLRGHVVILGERQDVTLASISRSQFLDRLRESPLVRRLTPTGGWRLLPGVDDGPPTTSLEDIFLRVAGVPLPSVDPATELATLGLDSLAQLELVLALEDAMGHTAPEDLVSSMRTVGDLLGWRESAA